MVHIVVVMLGFLRRVCSLLSHLFFRTKRSVESSSGARDNVPLNTATEEQWESTNQWGQGAENDWEPFTVQVVPNDEPVPTDPPEQNSAELDLFSDMQPVFKRPTMIRVARKEKQEAVDLQKFSVQDNNFTEDTGLGVWSDDMASGWEDTLDQDEDDLRKALRNKRAHEREQRRLQQENLRTHSQLKTYGLGTRVS